MMTGGPILVFGATGQQGGAVARALLARGHQVRAFTRSAASPAAAGLAGQGVTVVEGDMDDPASVVAGMDGAAGVFSVQTFMGPGGVEGEVRQGTTVGDAARQVGVPHIVYSSVDGAERNSGVPHFDSKWQVEQHLRGLDLPLTVLRPTLFLDNFASFQRPVVENGELVVRLAIPADKPIQMVAVADLGSVAADAFEHPDAAIGTMVALAADELTGTEIAAAFQRVTGLPTHHEHQPLEQVRAFSEDLALMYGWLADHGYQADIPALRRRYPGLQTLESWLVDTAWQPRPAAPEWAA